MNTKRMMITGAIIFALLLSLILVVAGERDKKLFSVEDTRSYIEYMGGKYGTDCGV